MKLKIAVKNSPKENIRFDGCPRAKIKSLR